MANYSTTPTVGNEDDGYWTVNLPFNINYLGSTYSTVYIGTNSYITFGQGSTTFGILSASNPSVNKIFISAADNSGQRLTWETYGSAPNRAVTIKFEGTTAVNGDIGAPNLVWEATFYEAMSAIIDIRVIARPVVSGTITGVYASTTSPTSTTGTLNPTVRTIQRIYTDSSGNAYISALPAPTKTLYISGNTGTMLIGNYGISLGADGHSGAVTDPSSYANDLYFHSGLPYIQILSKATPAVALVYPAVSRGVFEWSDGSKSVCFTPNTQISMYNGSVKLIKDVKIGDLVWNKDRTQANTVTFIEKAPAELYMYVYSHDPLIPAFATVTHPLFIDSKYKSPTPEAYIWLDTEYLDPANLCKAESVCDTVYNLWTTGDHTYIVNGVGTHSIVDDGGAMLNCYHQGLVTAEQCAQIIIDVSSDTPEHLYGSYLINKALGHFNYSIVNKLLYYFATPPRTTLRRKLFKLISKIVGVIAKNVRKI